MDYRPNRQEHNITNLKTITQHTHVLHTANGHMTLGFPRDMQGTTKLDTSTYERLIDDDTLRLGNGHMYFKSIRSLKHYKELEGKVIDTYLKQICKKRGGIKSC